VKKSLFGLLLIFPFAVSAQTNQTLLKDFEKKVDFLTGTCRVNDHLNIAQIAIDPENSELVAIDNKMQVLWRATFKGSLGGVGVFKDHILALGANHSDKSKAAIEYTAYMLDEQSGKVTLQKVYYTNSDPTEIQNTPVFAKDGSWLKILIRETGAKKRGGFVDMDKFNETHGLSVLSVNDDLTVANSNPHLADGQYAGFAVTAADSYCIFYLQPDGMLRASEYKSSQNTPPVSIVQSLDMRTGSSSEQITFNCTASATENNVAYFSIIHRNPQKDYELSICKLDFKQGQAKLVNQPLLNDHLKSIEKAFVRPDKKLDNPNVGHADFLVLKTIADYDGTLIITYGADFFKGNYHIQNSSVIDGYDKDLKLKYEQVMPNETTYGPTGNLSASIYREGDKMYMITNYGDMTYYTIYGQMDLNTGKWLKLQRLEKEKLSKSDFVTPHNLWYKDNFLLFYVPFKNGLNSKLDFSLQSNPY
jgi:hypothetical protein